MDDAIRQSGAGHEDGTALDPVEPIDAPQAFDEAPGGEAQPDYEESLLDEVAALIDDGRTYAEAEIGFQKTRARLAGRTIGVAIAGVLFAAILLHIAMLALAVGLVMALAPLVTIWGAIAIVVGALLAGTAWLAIAARNRGRQLSALFAKPPKVDEE